MRGPARTFCEQAAAGIAAHSGSMPADLDIPALTQDLADFAKLDAFYTEYLTLGEKIDDTLEALSSDVMTQSIIGVTFLKALNKLNPGLDTLLAGLRIVRRAKPANDGSIPPSRPQSGVITMMFWLDAYFQPQRGKKRRKKGI